MANQCLFLTRLCCGCQYMFYYFVCSPPINVRNIGTLLDCSISIQTNSCSNVSTFYTTDSLGLKSSIVPIKAISVHLNLAKHVAGIGYDKTLTNDNKLTRLLNTHERSHPRRQYCCVFKTIHNNRDKTE